MMKKNILLIEKYLEELFPNPKCELEYKKDYELLIAVMLSAQTTDKGVNKVTKVLFSKYDSLEKLKNANIEDIKEIIRPIGNYNKKAKNIIIIASLLLNDFNGSVPKTHDELETLPGVGRKTANVVLGELFNIPSLAVDTHVARVTNRLNLVNSNNPLIIEEKLKEYFPEDNWTSLHKQFVLFGRYHCKAIKPNCHSCKLRNICKKDQI